jgi:hypothetical protein
MTTYRRVCGLCGRPFAIPIPPGAEETERDKMCWECAALPAPPDGESDVSRDSRKLAKALGVKVGRLLE